MIKILHTADIHLRGYEDDRWTTLQRLIEIGKKEKIGIFVISGDLFDKDINAESLRPKIRDLFSNTGFKFILIPGNHDSDSYKSGLYFGENVTILTDLNTPFEDKDVRIWGMPFEPVEEEEVLNKLRSLAGRFTSDKKNILLYHGELLDTFFSRRDFGNEGEIRYMSVRLSYFKDLNIDYVLAGHFHSHFDLRKISENRGYFIYPGSPISITEKETGQRKINIFEVGEPPKEYLLSTPYFEEIVIEFDPYQDKDPLKTVTTRFKNLPPEAKALLMVKGFVNSEAIGMSEEELVNQIKEIVGERCREEYYYFRDIHTIIEDDLFKRFIEKLKQADYPEGRKKQICNIAINAMMKSNL